MAEPNLDAGITEEELRAAIAEIEALRAADPEREAAVDERSADNVVPVPLPGPRSRPAHAADPEPAVSGTGPSESESQAANSADTCPPDAAPPAELWRRAVRFARRALRRLPFVGPRLAPAGEALAPTVSTPETEAGPLACLLLRLLDVALALINRPFAFLTPGARHTLGLVALATIVTALLAAYFLPQMTPQNDPVFFLRQQPDERVVAPAPPPAETPP